MATKKTDKSITNIFGSVAAAQTMVEQFPFSFGKNEKGFTCTFDLLTSIFNLISDEPLEQKIISIMSEKLADENCQWLQGIEETIKMALELNITNLITCDMSPIIPDSLISCGEFLPNSNNSLNFQGEGITIPVSALDITGLLGNCPTDDNNPMSVAYYFSCYSDNYEYKSINKDDIPENITPVSLGKIPSDNQGDYIVVNNNYYVWKRSLLTINDLWKHDDFNAFLWYVKNKGVYGNTIERQKLIWDNRYKTKPYTKYERKPEHFFTMNKKYSPLFPYQEHVFPFSGDYLEKYNSQVNYKKRQILECRYIDGDGIHSDSFQFRLPASNYYKTRKLSGKKKDSTIWAINKTIFEFNHDFIMSLKLFDAKTYLCQMVNNLLGVGNISFNFSITRDSEQIEATIDSIIEKVINLSDIEIEDCYFTFSNEEYDQMLQNALEKRQATQNNYSLSNELIEDIKNIDNEATKVETKTKIITNALSELTRESKEGTNVAGSWKLNYDYQFELIRMLVYPLIRPLFSPKVMALLLINLQIMGDPLKLTENKAISFKEIAPYFMGIMTNIIKQIKDIINEMLYSWVIEKLTPLLTLFTLRTIMEQIEMYRQLIMDMITACSGFNLGNLGINFNKNGYNDMLDNVDYVDIDPKLEELKQTPISKTNC